MSHDHDFGDGEFASGEDAADISLTVLELQANARREAGLSVSGTKRPATQHAREAGATTEKSPRLQPQPPNILLTEEQFKKLVEKAVTSNSADIVVAVIKAGLGGVRQEKEKESGTWIAAITWANTVRNKLISAHQGL